jgi:hypothetical protein
MWDTPNLIPPSRQSALSVVEGASPLPKQSVFQTTYFLFLSTLFAFQVRLFAAKKLLQKKSRYFAVN